MCILAREMTHKTSELPVMSEGIVVLGRSMVRGDLRGNGIAAQDFASTDRPLGQRAAHSVS